MTMELAGHQDAKGKPLPPGWRWVRLGEVCEFKRGPFGGSLKKEIFVRSGYKVYEQQHAIQDNFEIGNYYITEEKFSEMRSFAVLPGDLIISCSGTMGRVAIVPNNVKPGIINQALLKLTPMPDKACPNYLKRYLQSESIQSRYFRVTAGAAIHNVTSVTVLKDIFVPLPPLTEQKRIGTVLNEQMTAVEKAQSATEEQLEAAKSFPDAYLREVFPQPCQELPPGWRWVRLGEVCEITAQQVDPRIPKYAVLPHVSGENIESGTGRLFELKTAAQDGMMSGKYLFEPGSVLYSKLRPYLRKAAAVDFHGLCSADMYPIKVTTGMNSDFLVWLLLSAPFTGYADSESRRARMPKLNRDQLFAFKAALPPLADQKIIAAQLSEKMAAVEKVRTALEEQLNEINALPAVLLRQAFAWEI